MNDAGDVRLLERITRDPAVMGGKPCLRGIRITVGMVLGLLATGMSEAEVVEAYPELEREDIQAVLAYAARCVEEHERPLTTGPFDVPPVPLREDDGGVIRVVASRVTLDSIVAVFDGGGTPEEIAESFSTVTLEQVYRVLAYVLSRRADVDRYLARRGREADELRAEIEKRFPSDGLRERLLARRRAT